jgi:hypothetical protein
MISQAYSLPWGLTAVKSLKTFRTRRVPESLSYLLQSRNQCSVCFPYSLKHSGDTIRLEHMLPPGKNWRVCGTNGNLLSPQTEKFLEVKSCSQYTRKRSI